MAFFSVGLTKELQIFVLSSEVRKHRWFSGRMLACHAGGPGSIPGRCNYLFFKSNISNFVKILVTLHCIVLIVRTSLTRNKKMQQGYLSIFLHSKVTSYLYLGISKKKIFLMYNIL